MSPIDDNQGHPMGCVAPIPLRWAEQIMEMVATCHMKSIEGTDWRACEEIAAWIKGLYPDLFEARRYWYALPDRPTSEVHDDPHRSGDTG